MSQSEALKLLSHLKPADCDDPTIKALGEFLLPIQRLVHEEGDLNSETDFAAEDDWNMPPTSMKRILTILKRVAMSDAAPSFDWMKTMCLMIELVIIPTHFVDPAEYIQSILDVGGIAIIEVFHLCLSALAKPIPPPSPSLSFSQAEEEGEIYVRIPHDLLLSIVDFIDNIMPNLTNRAHPDAEFDAEMLQPTLAMIVVQELLIDDVIHVLTTTCNRIDTEAARLSLSKALYISTARDSDMIGLLLRAANSCSTISFNWINKTKQALKENEKTHTDTKSLLPLLSSVEWKDLFAVRDSGLPRYAELFFDSVSQFGLWYSRCGSFVFQESMLPVLLRWLAQLPETQLIAVKPKLVSSWCEAWGIDLNEQITVEVETDEEEPALAQQSLQEIAAECFDNLATVEKFDSHLLASRPQLSLAQFERLAQLVQQKAKRCK